MPAQKANDAPRRPGRPRGKKNGAASREQLMDIALTLFARDGMTRVSLNAIAREAGVTPAMLHYYFSSREALVDNLLQERFIPLRNAISHGFIAYPDEPLVAFTLLMTTLAEMAEQHPWFAPLWMQEMIGEIPLLRAQMHARFGDEQYYGMLERVRRWQREGKINPALAPELLFITLISLVLVPFSRLRSDERLTFISAQNILNHALALITQGIGGK